MESKSEQTNWRFLFKPISIIQLFFNLIAFVLIIILVLNINTLNIFQIIMYLFLYGLLISSNLYGISAIYNY